MNETAVFAEDDRRPIERLRRAQLWRVADAYGLNYPNGADKNTMIQLLEGSGVDVTQPLPDGSQLPWQWVEVPDANGNTVRQLHPVHEQRKSSASTADVHRLVEQQEQERQKEAESPGDDDEKAELRATIQQMQEQQERMMAQMERLMAGQAPDAGEAPSEETTAESHTEPAQEPDSEPGPDPHKADESGAEEEHETTQAQDESDGGNVTSMETGLAKIARLRRQCKDAGITILRTDRTSDLERKLREASSSTEAHGGSDENDAGAQATEEPPEQGSVDDDDEWEV